MHFVFKLVGCVMVSCPCLSLECKTKAKHTRVQKQHEEHGRFRVYLDTFDNEMNGTKCPTVHSTVFTDLFLDGLTIFERWENQMKTKNS